MRSDRRGPALALLLALPAVITACEIEKVAIPETQPSIVLHSVLSATATSQVLVLERTRTGAVASFELGDPLVTPALAETSAVVQLMAPDGSTIAAVEDRRNPANGGRGGGIYRFPLDGVTLEAGGTYRLSVRTAGGDQLAAETVVPAGTGASAPQPFTFDRAADTLVLEWPASAGARSYLVRVETPFGPRTFFTDSTRVRLPGTLRNVDAISLPHVFMPGFPQAVTVSAVDPNFYDWYRTSNNRISGEGLVSRVEGGLGVFGSLVRLRFDSLDVVAPQTDAASGMFAFDGTQLEASVTPNLSLVLYIDSRSARGDQPDAISGRYNRRTFLGMIGCATCGLIGSVRAGHVELAMLTDWMVNDTADVFVGDLRGDTLVGAYQRNGFAARYVKVR